MRKYLLFFLLITVSLHVLAQKPTEIKIQESQFSTYQVENGEQVVYIRKPVFLHENSILTCDSAKLNVTKNSFEAYRNVHIIQADTLNIYSQRLTYDGNTKKAHLTENVRLQDGTSTLTTNILDYDMAARIGTYTNNGRIVNKDVRVTSKNGYYFANTRDAYFRYNVVVITGQSTIKSDTLRYNTVSNWTYFYGPTHIQGKDDNLYTENGQYNTSSENAFFGKKNLYRQGSRSMRGDSLYYDGKKGYGRAVKNIFFVDTADNTLLRGQLGEYFKADERVMVTRNAYFGMQSDDSITVRDVKTPDTLWLGADTLETLRVRKSTVKPIPYPVIAVANKKPAAAVGNNKLPGTLPAAQPKPGTPGSGKAAVDAKLGGKGKIPALSPDSSSRDKQDTLKIIPAKLPAKDTAAKPLDTARSRIIMAYHNVKVFKGNFQARADSLFYSDADSTMRWYNNPILWAESSQQTGDTIYVQLKDRKISSMQVIGNGFMVNVEGDSTKFNQIKGRKTTGFFSGGELKTMIVDGNAESLYYNKEGNKYKNMHQGISGTITFSFKNKALSGIREKNGSEGKLTPMEELKGENLLTGFIWKPELRPVSKADVIGKPNSLPVKPVKAPVKPVNKPVPKPAVKKGTGKP